MRVPTADGQLAAELGRLVGPEHHHRSTAAGRLLTGQNWARVAASAGLWVLVPLGLGLIRLLKEEVK
jgi:hypothetical protein